MNKKDLAHVVASIFRKTLIVLSGLILSLVLLEAGLRLGGFILSSIQESENFRSIKQNGTYRILCIGESTTQGQYPHLLEQVLNQRNIGVRFSVIDKGRGSKRSNTLLKEIIPNLAEYHPDMVVAMMGINDAGVRYYQDIPDSESWLFRHCRVYRFGRILYMHFLKKLQRKDIYGPDSAHHESKPKRGSKGTAIEKADLPSKVFVDGVAKSDPENDDKENLEARGFPQQGDNLFELPESPGTATGCLRSGQLYRAQGEFFKAEDSFKRAIELNPKNDLAYVELGQLYLKQGKLSQAGALFEKAFELNLGTDIGVMLARYYRMRGESQKAEDLLKKIIRSDPTNAFAYFELGWLYRLQGKLPQAEAALERSMLYPEKAIDVQVIGALLLLYEEMGKPELAKEYAEKAYRMRANPSQYGPIAVDNYHKLKGILDKRGVKLVCVQYPMRDVKQLEEIFKKDEGVIFVDNEGVFKEALKKNGYKYKEYFRDMFAGDFGHCTPKGNMLLAQNIAEVILREVFDKR